jgi:hypothetical protein
MKLGKKDIWASVLSVGLLGGVVVDMRSLSAPDDAGPYHARVREAQASMPAKIADWTGEETALPPAAMKMLRPNVAVCKQYKNMLTGRRAMFLLVQVADARDLLSHYPPVCYAVQGYRNVKAKQKDWQVGDLEVQGMEYEFEFRTFEKSESKHIANFMIMPDGTIQRDMEAIEAQASDLRKRFYGAAQVQIVVDTNYPAEEREQIFRDLVGGNRQVIDAIRSGVKQP